jgi:dihydrofolate reductase
MRKLIYYIACSADRFIAREDGSFNDFPTEGEHLADLLKLFPETVAAHMRQALGIRAENQCFDDVLMGRRTYEVGKMFGVTNPYPHMKQYLFSRSLKNSPDPNVELVSSDAVASVQGLKQQTGKDIWLCGAADLAASLFTEIDEVILKVNPFLLGTGIPLFSRSLPKTDLEVLNLQAYRNGFMRVHYRVKH